jgi:hypothetical protein
LHQLAEMLFNQLHRPYGTSTDLHLSPVPRPQKLTLVLGERDGEDRIRVRVKINKGVITHFLLCK